MPSGASSGSATGRVLIYVGKFTGWYMEREMVDFFAAARRLDPTLFFLILTQADRELIRAELARAGIPEADYAITRAAPEQVGAYLAAADLGISFIRRCFSKISSSPTKIGEYLGAGLPVVSSAGIGDVDRLLDRETAPASWSTTSAPAGLEVAAARTLRADRRSLAWRRAADRSHTRSSASARSAFPATTRLYRDVAALDVPSASRDQGWRAREGLHRQPSEIRRTAEAHRSPDRRCRARTTYIDAVDGSQLSPKEHARVTDAEAIARFPEWLTRGSSGMCPEPPGGLPANPRRRRALRPRPGGRRGAAARLRCRVERS